MERGSGGKKTETTPVTRPNGTKVIRNIKGPRRKSLRKLSEFEILLL
jgi:hypothetical protein